jgi:hypothetical protein
MEFRGFLTPTPNMWNSVSTKFRGQPTLESPRQEMFSMVQRVAGGGAW